MIYKEKPQEYNPKFDVVSCFVEYDGEILLLHRQDNKPQGNTWGAPAGKVDTGEQILDTMVREIIEETGIVIAPEQLSYFGKFYVKYPEFDFNYHIFSTRMDKQHDITISRKEHKEFRWMTPEDALKMTLVPDMDACIKEFYNLLDCD